MMSFHNRAGRQVVRGLPQELVDRLVARQASPGHIPDSTTYCATVTPFDSEALKVELESMLQEAGGTLLYHTQLAATEVSHGRIQSVTLCNKAGLTRMTASVFIDATGDADLAAQAGVSFQKGREGDGAMQPLTMNLKVGNVNTHAIREYVLAHPDDFNFPHGQDEGMRRVRETPRLSLGGFKAAWSQARERGEVDVPRDDVLFFETATPGVLIFNTSRIQGLDPTDPYALTEAETIGRRQCQQIFRFLKKYCPGFADAIRMDTAAQVGVRESRRVRGLYTLTQDDLLTCRDFPDPIAMGGYPIDIHSPDGVNTHTTHLAPDSAYAIPLRSILVEEPTNLLVAGRCLSATHEASAATRVTPIAMAIGQAAGTAAAICCQRGCLPKELPYAVLRESLRTQGACLPQTENPARITAA